MCEAWGSAPNTTRQRLELARGDGVSCSPTTLGSRQGEQREQLSQHSEALSQKQTVNKGTGKDKIFHLSNVKTGPSSL